MLQDWSEPVVHEKIGFCSTRLSETTDNLGVEERSNLVAGVTADSPQKTGFVVVLKKRSSGLLVGLQSLGESLLLKLLENVEYECRIETTYRAVISTTSQGFAGNIVNSGNSWRVPSIVVNTSRRLVDHSASNTLEDDIGGDIKVDDLSRDNSQWKYSIFPRPVMATYEVHVNLLVEALSLLSCAGETVQQERRARRLGSCKSSSLCGSSTQNLERTGHSHTGGKSRS